MLLSARNIINVIGQFSPLDFIALVLREMFFVYNGLSIPPV